MAAGSQSHSFSAVCAFILCIAFLASRYHISSSFQRPIHFSVSTLFEAGLFIPVWHIITTWPKTPRLIYDEGFKPLLAFHGPIPKPVVGWSPWLRARLAFIRTVPFSSLVPFLACVFAARGLLFWFILKNVHCSVVSSNPYLPALVAAGTDAVSKTVHIGQPASRSERRRSCLVHARYVVLALIWAYAVRTSVDMTSSSTGVICPPAPGQWAPYTPVAQGLAVTLDAVLFLGISKFRLGRGQEDGASGWSLVSQLFLTSALSLLALASSEYNPNVGTDPSIKEDPVAIQDLVFDSIAAASALVLGTRILGDLRPRTLALVVSSVVAYVHHLFRDTQVGYPNDSLALVIGAVVGIGGVEVLLAMDKDVSPRPGPPGTNARLLKQLSKLYIALTGLLCCTYVVLAPGWALRGDVSLFSVVDSARIRSQSWMVQANRSKTLLEAVKEYERRYGIPPPPGFDKWFGYATALGSVVVDDFTQISTDLEPFWGISPEDLRKQTSHLLAHQLWLGMGGIRIRGGTVETLPGVPGTHLWMMEALVELIEPFAEHLPNMDFAFNLNDEPRVAISNRELAKLNAEGSQARAKLANRPDTHDFGAGVSPDWFDGVVREAGDHSPYFTEEIRNQHYYDYVAPSCSPATGAQRGRWWNRKDACRPCLAPHTIRIAEAKHSVILDWPMASDLCHQPDLAYLHGFLLTPGASVPTKKEFPVFSQGKTTGFADILIPSPWNFVDKVAYNETEDMAWAEKNNTLFWRGASSDGYAADGSWHSFLRARFVKAATSFSPPASWNAKAPANGPHIASLPGVDVNFVGDFGKCHQHDCQSEKETFWGLEQQEPPENGVEFGEHWRYQHLVDMDGAGFSGRFIPFLESRSLVYGAGVFQTWIGERVHAWRHYVPVDVRMHEIWDLLWFFGGEDQRGLDGAEEIAMEGRRWAKLALRKEDMRIYMFRLLLEWGRLVDDERESLGYTDR